MNQQKQNLQYNAQFFKFRFKLYHFLQQIQISIRKIERMKNRAQNKYSIPANMGGSSASPSGRDNQYKKVANNFAQQQYQGHQPAVSSVSIQYDDEVEAAQQYYQQIQLSQRGVARVQQNPKQKNNQNTHEQKGSSQPRHHKANSMQISSKYKVLQGQSKHHAANQNVIQKTSDNRQSQPEFENNRYLVHQGEEMVGDDNMASFTKQSHILMNQQQHIQQVKMKNITTGSQTISNHPSLTVKANKNSKVFDHNNNLQQDARSPNHQEPQQMSQQKVVVGGAHQVLMPRNALHMGQGMKNNSNIGAANGSQHKKANSLMNQKMMQLILNNQQEVGHQRVDQQQRVDGSQFRESGQPQTVYHHHVKSKSFMNNNQFIGAEPAHQTQMMKKKQAPKMIHNQATGGPQFVLNKKAQNQQNLMNAQMTYADQIQKPKKAGSQESSGITTKINFIQSSQTSAIGASVVSGSSGSQPKTKLISSSFDKTSAAPNYQNVAIGPKTTNAKMVSGGNMVQKAIIKKDNKGTGLKHQSFHINPNAIANKKAAKNIIGHGPDGNIRTAGMPTNVPSGMVTHGPVTGAVTGQITRGHVSGHQSIMTASSNNLQLGINDQHPKTDAPSHHQSALAHNMKGISNKVVHEIQSQGAVHSRTKSDANYIQSLHVQNTNKNNFVISSSNHVVYPGPGQNPSSVGSKKTHQSKKASNLKTMSNNNVSSQGATKGLLGYSNKNKFVKVNANQEGQMQEAAVKQQNQAKKTQIQNIVRSNLKNAARNDDEGGMMRGPQSISNNAQKQKKDNIIDVDLDVFNSSQNKTTEQKYADLKVKYNDLLNKHFALTSQQKTEDHRGKKIYQNNEMFVDDGSLPFNPNNNYPQTQQQTLESQKREPHIVQSGSGNGLNTKNQGRRVPSMGSRISGGKSQKSEHQINVRGSQDLDQYNINFRIDGQAEAEAQLNMIISGQAGGESNHVSNNHTPRAPQGLEHHLRTYQGAESQHAGSSNQNSTYNIIHSIKNSKIDNLRNNDLGQPSASLSQNISTSHFGEQLNESGGIYQINQVKRSRADGQGPLTQSRPNFSDEVAMQGLMKGKKIELQPNSFNKSRVQQNDRSGKPLTLNEAQKLKQQHKRSVSDGSIFSNIGMQQKSAVSSSGASGQPKIPLKKSQKNFEQKIIQMRQQNGLPALEEEDVIEYDAECTDLNTINQDEENVQTEGQEQIILNKNLVYGPSGTQMGNQMQRGQMAEVERAGNGSKVKMSRKAPLPRNYFEQQPQFVEQQEDASNRQLTANKPATTSEMKKKKAAQKAGIQQVIRAKQDQRQIIQKNAPQATASVTPDILEMNSVAKKYKQMRKTGTAVHGSQNYDQYNQNKIMVSDQVQQKVALDKKAPGGISSKAPGAQQLGHRRVKSGIQASTNVQQVSSATNANVAQGQNAILNNVVLFKNESKGKQLVKNNQNSIKNLKQGKTAKQGISTQKPRAPSNKFMLIYEDQQPQNTVHQNSVDPDDDQQENILDTQERLDESFRNNQIHSSSIDQSDVSGFGQGGIIGLPGQGTSPFGQCPFGANNKKVINVSFNDFNQSISNEYDDGLAEVVEGNDQHINAVNIDILDENSVNSRRSKTSHDEMKAYEVKSPQQQQAVLQPASNSTSNKNLNHFLEALQKIKPQNPLPCNSPVKQALIPKKVKPNKAAPSGDQNLRVEKYQKMMQKVGGHNRIKSTNDGAPTMNNQMKHKQGNYSVDYRGAETASHALNNAQAQQDNNISSEANMKITFVGDQALIKQQQKKQHIKNNSHMIGNTEYNKIQFHHKQPGTSNALNSASGSNTGGQPSPIISTKRVPQKILHQYGDGSISPPETSLQMMKNPQQINNFVLDEEGIESQQYYNELNENVVKQKKSQAKGPKQPSQGAGKKLKRRSINMGEQISNNNRSISPHSDFAQNQGGQNRSHFVSRAEISPHEQQETIGDIDPQALIQNLNKGALNPQDENAPVIRILEKPQPLSKNNYQQDLNAPLQTPTAPQVSERLVTDESCKHLTPRSKQIRKLVKLINISFKQSSFAPDTTIDFYRVGKVLGKGAFGKVNLAIHKLTQQLCAIKSINKQLFSDPGQTKKVMQEVVMLKKTKHPNIVRLFEYFETEKHILFVIEMCAGGDLLNYVRRRRRLKEDVAKSLFKQVIESLAYCHSKNILHRDIKLDNILLDGNGQVKICDFGVGKIVKQGERMTEQCGTPAYIAPEILRDQGYYGFAVDLWSAGVVLFAMLYGTVPFKAGNMQELQNIIMEAKYTLKDDISLPARNLLKGLLEKDPKKRLTVGAILNHEWMQDAKDFQAVELFTDQERQHIKNEFSYGKTSRFEGRNVPGQEFQGNDQVEFNSRAQFDSELDRDMFTEHMLDSTNNSILKNQETKSIVLAPFNSTKSNLNQAQDSHRSLSDSIKALIVDRRIIKFGPKVRDIDKQYEINNNADLDNGVYHNFEEEDQAPDDDGLDGKNNVKAQTEADEVQEEQEILDKLKKQEKKKQENTELQKLENMIQEREASDEAENRVHYHNMISQPSYEAVGGNLVTENSNLIIQDQQHQIINDTNSYIDEPQRNQQNNHMNIMESQESQKSEHFKTIGSEMQRKYEKTMFELYQQQQKYETLIIDEEIVNKFCLFGYPRDYMLKCLSNHELNYATTGYLLIKFQRQMQEVSDKMDWQTKLKNDSQVHLI